MAAQSPNDVSAAAAVAALQAELEMVERALDSTDRKAALVPVAVAAVGSLFVVPDAPTSEAPIVLLVAGVLVAAVSIVLALVALRTRWMSFGPNARHAAESVHVPAPYYRRAVAGSLADAIDLMSDVLKVKGRRLNDSMSAGALAIALLALSRVLGG